MIYFSIYENPQNLATIGNVRFQFYKHHHSANNFSILNCNQKVDRDLVQPFYLQFDILHLPSRSYQTVLHTMKGITDTVKFAACI